MAVHPQRTTWTDERLDDLRQLARDGFERNDADHRAHRQEMKAGFDRVDADHRALRQETQAGFDRVDAGHQALRQEMRAGFDRLDQRFDALLRALVISMAGLVTAIVASNLLG